MDLTSIPGSRALAGLGLALLAACSAGPSALTSSVAAPPGEFDHAHALLDDLLADYVHPDGVDYRGLGTRAVQLDRYLAGLHAVAPEQLASWTRDQRYAFWINTYNAHVLRLIVDHYEDGPPASIRDLGGLLIDRVWDLELIPMDRLNPSGTPGPLSLSEVEHEILRPRFEDARVHAAINCASVSCPPLLPEAFVAERLEEQLERAMGAFVADPSRNVLEEDRARLRLSAIFDWFEEDFVRDAGSVRAYVARYAPASEADWILAAEVDVLDYDWDLNDASDG